MARERHSPAYPSPRGESMFPADTRRLASRAAWCRCELRTAPMCCVVLIGLTYCASQCTYVHCTCVHVRGRLTKYMLAYNYQPCSQWCPALDIRHRCDRSQRVSTLRTPGSPVPLGLRGAAAPTHSTRRRETGARSSRPCKIRSDHWVSRSLTDCLLSSASEIPEWRGCKEGTQMDTQGANPIRQRIVRQ